MLDVQNDELPFITGRSKDDFKGALLQNGDIIIADTAEDETTGKVCEIVNIQDKDVVAGLHTMVCRPKNKTAEGYFGYYMNSSSYHHQLLPLMQGIKVLSLSKTNVQKTTVKYPKDKAEQQKIADCLRRIDTLITLHQRNELVEEKVDALVKEAETHLENVTINKVNSFTTSSPTDTENEDEIAVKGVAINKGTIIKGAVIAFIFAVFFVLFMNFVLYVFNPSMNGVSAFEKYGLKFIYEYRGTADLAEVLKYVEENEGKSYTYDYFR